MRWSYKTIHYELKKEGLLGSAFLDGPEIELSLNQYGKAGWELVSMLETMDGVIAIFKQPLDLETRSFAPPAGSSERMSRPVMGLARKRTIPDNVSAGKHKSGPLDEDIAEAMLLDEFEVVEETPEDKPVTASAVDKAPKPPVDIGKIRIE